jgi:DNA repair exonuclease SbcCD ATPase subunit
LLSKAETSETDAEKQALIQDASRLAEELAARQKELSRVAALQQQLRNDSSLKEMDNGPAKDFQDALAKGDLAEARKQLEKLAQMIREGKLSEEEKQKLAQQLKEIQEKLQQLAELKKRRDAIAKSNLDPETKRKELQRLNREMEKLRSAAKLAEQLGRCQQCLSREDAAEAIRALDAARSSLDEMIRDAQELAELEAALEDLDKLKECLGCKSTGSGSSAEEDDSDPPDEEIDDPTESEGRKDRSRGGKRKEKATDTDNKEERARAPIDPKGRILFQGYGPQQMKPDRDFVGKTTVDIGPALEETRHQASEAVRQQKLPQAQRDMVHEFYRNLLEQTSKAKPRE